MLKLVLGGSGSGKTTLLYSRIKARAEQGRRSILLVPEQFTSSTEGRIYRELGDALSGMVESFSFTSLAERILSAEGGAAVQTLSDAGRAVLVRRALEELQDHVHYYYRHRRSAAFCQMAAQTIDELKSAGLSGAQLAELAPDCGPESGKLSELALIFQGYETLLAGTGMDPADRLELAADRLEAALARGELPDFLREREVFIDEFDTFNAPKKRLMGAMLAALPTVTVALCDDGAPMVPGDMGLFSGAKQVAAQLRQLARKNGAEAAVPELLRRDLRHKDAPGLAAVTELLETGTCEVPPAAPEVRLFAAASREEEARCTAAAIRRLMRQGVRCGKMAVVCRNIPDYRAAIRYEFRMADIPLYCDEPTTPEFSAPATAVRALLALLRGADMTENLTILAKTGLCALTEPQVCALENYAYTWSPNAAAWRTKFEKSPKGFGENELSDEDAKTLEDAETARQLLVTAVDELRSKVRGGSAEQISRELYFCLKKLGAEEQQAALVEAVRTARGIPAAEEAAREWNVVMQLLNEMAHLLGGQGVTFAEYEDLFSLLLRSSDLGHIPQTLDAVVLASAGKMRLDAPDYVFVLGLAEGEFPCAPSETGLLTHADRDVLMAKQIDLPDCFENRVVREQVCVYKALTAPAKGLWLSWPKGQGKTLCAALEPIVEALHPAAPELELPDLAATPADALDTLGGWPLTDTERASLTEALRLPQTDAPRGLALLQRMEEDPPRQVNDLSALSGLLGQRLRISPSQLEKYYTCRYGYFLQYVLGLKPRRRAELSADQSGTLMHWVLQMALDPHPDADNPCNALTPFLELDDEAMAGLASLLVDEYAKRYLPEDTARFAYLLSRLKKSMTSLLCYLRDEQKQSCFHPAACELRIGSGEDAVPGHVYHLSDGRTVQLVGTVDRADEWVEENGTRWVRVVDYKTGTKKLNLKEVYCGLDCQMLLYLFSLTRDKSGRFTGAEPAGVLYLLADPAPKTTNRQQAQQDVQYELDGLVRDEQKVFDAMDADETGCYLPFGYRNGVPSPSQKDKRADIAKLNRIQLHLDDLVTQMGQQLYDGQIAAEPLVAGAGRNPCVWCDYSFICCHETGIGERALEAPAKPFEPEETENEKEGEQA
ncbi:ATP-binding protein [Faecalibacterium sp. OF03-6AC]|uniref:PD-(D/E)XK nuclease family protein n=1 Tax=Faecalibacterium TaxID=216851 RepID=UPI000E48433C|nr:MULTISPECIES: PD-(D/E)XK nuclease family protein [Faecalibacterium]RHP64971.1 ATP-binding protein [Faecalibacterium sp. OF03-6AC]